MDLGSTFPLLAQIYSKDGGAILASLTTLDCHKLHMALGVPGEVGELIDAVKKEVIYRKPADRANVVEEIADIRFYLAGLMNAYNITEAELEQQERNKLEARYSTGRYSDQQAKDRADKILDDIADDITKHHRAGQGD